MGQYLAIGLATEITINKDEIKKTDLDFTGLKRKMVERLHFIPEIYDLEENNQAYEFSLKASLIHQELIPFLQAVYPVLYSSEDDYSTVIKKLVSIDPEDWLELAGERSEYAFQYDAYGDDDYISAGFYGVHISYDCLMLSMEGKAFLETFGQQRQFLKYTMQHAFSQFRLAGAFRIYITG